MVFRNWHVHLAEGLFNCVHHHRGSTDEVLVSGVWQRQMAFEHLGADEALFARPAGWRICEYVDDCQIEFGFLSASSSSRKVQLSPSPCCHRAE